MGWYMGYLVLLVGIIIAVKLLFRKLGRWIRGRR